MRVAVLSSNLYVRFLPGFANCFARYWPGQTVDVVCYDVLPPDLPPSFEIISLGRQESYSWSAGLLAYLRTVREDAVCLFLEDYWLTKPVDTAAVAMLETWLRRQPDVGKIDLTADRSRFPHRELGTQGGLTLIRADRHAPFLANLQVALWQTTLLYALLDDREDPWEFELNGTRRLAGWPHIAVLGTTQPPVVYAQLAKGRKPDLLRHDKLPPAELERLTAAGVLKSWGYPCYPDGREGPNG